MFKIVFYAHYWAEGCMVDKISDTFVGSDQEVTLFINDTVRRLLDSGFEDVEVECHEVRI